MRSVFQMVCLTLVSTSAFTQPGYRIDFRVKGLRDTTTYLGFYQGEGTYIKDTTRIDSHGTFSFEGTRTLPQGVYFLVLNKTKLAFDFLVSSDQHFSIETDTAEYYRNMKVTGDEDNRLFFENILFNADRRMAAEPFIKVVQDSSLRESEKKDAREAVRKINEELAAFHSNIIEKNPTTLTARFLKASKQVEVPDPPKKADGTIDSTFQFRYYRSHYFDNFDLSDDALLRLPKPFYVERVKDYLDRLFVQDPDTLTKAIDRIVAKAKRTPETYKYLVWTCVTYYQSHKIMGLDRVYVNLFDKYIATGEMDFWLDKKVKQSIKEYVDKVRLSLIGNTAPNLVMQDQNFQARSMYDIKKRYTILYIFNPDCGHCKEETPKLVNFYNKSRQKFDFEVYAVSTDTSMKKMRDFVSEMKTTWITVNGPRTYVGIYSKLYHADTTPTMYVIDDRRKIIAKKLPVDQLAEFFEKHEKFGKKHPNGNKGT